MPIDPFALLDAIPSSVYRDLPGWVVAVLVWVRAVRRLSQGSGVSVLQDRHIAALQRHTHLMSITPIPKHGGVALANYMPSRAGYQGFVLHWTAGSLEGTLAEFRNPLRQASYNWVVDGENVYELVRPHHTAYHAGVLSVNRNFQGVALVGGQPGKDANGNLTNFPVPQKTIDTAVEFLAQMIVAQNQILGPVTFDAVRFINGSNQRVKVNSHRNIIGHREVKPTACPGNVNEQEVYDRVVARVAQLKGIQAPPAPVEAPRPQVNEPVPVFRPFPAMRQVRVMRDANFRAAPSTASKINVTWDVSPRAARFVNVVGTVQGQSWNGSTLWLKTQGGNYIHSLLTNYR